MSPFDIFYQIILRENPPNLPEYSSAFDLHAPDALRTSDSIQGGIEMTTSRPKVRLITAAIAILISITPAWSQKPGGKRGVDVATVNLYVGADFAPITTLNPADPDYPVQLVTSVATIHAIIVASNFPARAAALAQEIVARSPDIVALQEVSLLRRQSPGDLIAGGTVPATDSRTGLSADSACRAAPIWWPLCRRFTGSEHGCGTAAGDRPVHIR